MTQGKGFCNRFTRLPLAHAFNVRDLGGYAAENGRATNWGAFLRADELSKLDDGDIAFLLDYGVDSVVDLRGPEEAAELPNALAKLPGVDYVNIPMSEGNVVDAVKLMAVDPQRYIREYYVEMIDRSHAAIRAVFDVFARPARVTSSSGGSPAPCASGSSGSSGASSASKASATPCARGGCTLFHCFAGKDRTGVIAMLLLGLCGVGKHDIVANYEVSFTCAKNSPSFAGLLKNLTVPIEVMHSAPAYIEAAIDRAHALGGSIEGYLADVVKVPRDTLDAVKRKLL